MATEQALPTPVPLDYGLERVPLKGRSTREDWRVHTPTTTQALERTDLVSHLRRFFDALDQELDEHREDPIALAQALARMEALLADMRYVRDRTRDLAAEALDTHQVRRLTVDSVCTVEASSTVNRTDWDHHGLATALLQKQWDAGLINHPRDVVDLLLSCAGIGYWRQGACRDLGVDPDQYCKVERDEDGKLVRTPTVAVKDNVVRRMR